MAEDASLLVGHSRDDIVRVKVRVVERDEGEESCVRCRSAVATGECNRWRRHHSAASGNMGEIAHLCTPVGITCERGDRVSVSIELYDGAV